MLKAHGVPSGPATRSSFPASAEHGLLLPECPYISPHNLSLALNTFTKLWTCLTPLYSVRPARVSPPPESLSWSPLTLPNSQPGLGALFWHGQIILCLTLSCGHITGVKSSSMLVSPLHRDPWGWNVSSSLHPRHPSTEPGTRLALSKRFRINVSSLHRLPGSTTLNWPLGWGSQEIWPIHAFVSNCLVHDLRHLFTRSP